MRLIDLLTLATLIVANILFVDASRTRCIKRRKKLSDIYIDCLQFPKELPGQPLPAKRIKRCGDRLKKEWRKLSRNRPDKPPICPIEPHPFVIVDLVDVCKDASLEGEECKELSGELIELSTEGSTSPAECPCAFNLEKFKKGNLDVKRGACSGEGYPNGASIATKHGSFHAASIFDEEIDEGFCSISRDSTQIITVKETKACIEEIADRCSELGRPIRN